jgi:replicative DNA helicase
MPESEILDRLPPHDLDAERQTIGSALIEPRILDDMAGVVSPDDFYATHHAVLYAHLTGMVAAGRPIDSLLLLDRIRSCGDLERIGGTTTLAEVAGSVAVHSHWRHYASIVARHAMRRRIIQAAIEALRDAYAEDNPEHTLTVAEQALSAIRTGSYDRAPVTMADAVDEALANVGSILERGHRGGCMTGLEEFDKEVGGFFAGELAILAARPGEGKTSLALQIAAHIAGRGRTVYFATLEMGAAELALKRLCGVAGVSNQRVRTGKIAASDQRQLIEAAGSVGLKNFHLHDWPSIRVSDIERSARRLKADIVFVDYLQIVTPSDKKAQRYEQVGGISSDLKQMSRRLNVPVIACCQLGRQVANEKSGAPRLHHLRESGNIEQDADVVLLLWRPESGVPTKNGDNADAGLEVAKNRKGVRTRILLDWDGDTTTFSDRGLRLPPSGAWSPDNTLPVVDDF